MFTPFAFMGTKAGGGGTPADTFISAVVSAGGSLSAGEQTAISTFYSSLYSAGIYSKLIQMYTFMGGVSASNAINFINPGTNDLTFNGTWTHNASGSFAAQNNANYADTGFNTLTNEGIVTASLAFGYQNNAPQTTSATYGYMGNGTGTSNYSVLGYDTLGTDKVDNFNPTSQQLTLANAGVNHFNAMARTSTTSVAYYANDGVSAATATSAQTWSGSPYNGNLHINRINGTTYPAGGRYTFFFIGDGLSSTDLANVYSYLNTMNGSFTNRQL